MGECASAPQPAPHAISAPEGLTALENTMFNFVRQMNEIAQRNALTTRALLEFCREESRHHGAFYVPLEQVDFGTSDNPRPWYDQVRPPTVLQWMGEVVSSWSKEWGEEGFQMLERQTGVNYLELFKALLADGAVGKPLWLVLA